MTKEELEEKREKELERWQQRQLHLQQEFARELGIHQGRMSILNEQVEAEESVTEDT